MADTESMTMEQYMEKNERTRDLLIRHYRDYPSLDIRDIFKYLHQSAMGCEHLVFSLPHAIRYIEQEAESCTVVGGRLVDRLDGEYSRVHLAYLREGLSAETLGRLFYMSAKPEEQGRVTLEHKLEIASSLVREGVLPLDAEAFDAAVREWKAVGYPAVHHSEVFRSSYAPAYRVIANRYVCFLPLLARLDALLAEKQVVLAIDGGSASGKSTLSELLRSLYDCTVLHMDDFFLRPEQRTAERFREVGGNVDRERFLSEVLLPMERSETIHYRRFDCATGTVQPAEEIARKRLTVVEGVYAMHPDLAEHYDLTVFLDIAPTLQRERIAKRNSPQMAERFHREWIPLENRYFSGMQVKERCDLCISIEA